MKTENGKIIEATEAELFNIYLKREFYEMMSFTDYMSQCEHFGTRIVKEDM